MSSDRIDYQQLASRALRSVVHQVLADTAAYGLPGDHHFYLTFDTTHPGVEISRYVRDLYPQEMTIVLQHQFWDLVVDDEVFAVSLRFGGAKQRLVVPFEALKSFVDPAAEFGLHLDIVAQPTEPTETAEEPTGAEPSTGPTKPDAESTAGSHDGGDVVSIDRFRRKPS